MYMSLILNFKCYFKKSTNNVNKNDLMRISKRQFIEKIPNIKNL